MGDIMNGKILLRVFCLFCKAHILSLNLISERVFSIRLSGKPLSRNLRLNCVMLSSNVAFEELVLRSLKASPLIKPFLTPGGWQEEKCVYWKVSVGLKCVRTSRMDSFLNLSPLYTHVSRKVISLSEISAVNFMVG